MAATLYNLDYHAWAREQAEALRAGRLDALDLAHLAEELDDLGSSRCDALEAALARIIEHLLKLEYSPAREPRRGWRLSVTEHRDRAGRNLEDNPSLRPQLAALFPRAWRTAHKLAGAALHEFDGMRPSVLSADCPYTLEQVLAEDWWPVNRHGLE